MLAKGGKGKGKKKKGSTQQSGNVANPDIDCWNCGEKGHTYTRLLGAYMHHTLNASPIYFNVYSIHSNFYQNIKTTQKYFS